MTQHITSKPMNVQQASHAKAIARKLHRHAEEIARYASAIEKEHLVGLPLKVILDKLGECEFEISTLRQIVDDMKPRLEELNDGM